MKAPHAVRQAVPAGPEGRPARVAIAGASDEPAPAPPRYPAPELAHGQRLGGQVPTACRLRASTATPSGGTVARAGVSGAGRRSMRHGSSRTATTATRPSTARSPWPVVRWQLARLQAAAALQAFRIVLPQPAHAGPTRILLSRCSSREGPGAQEEPLQVRPRSAPGPPPSSAGPSRPPARRAVPARCAAHRSARGPRPAAAPRCAWGPRRAPAARWAAPPGRAGPAPSGPRARAGRRPGGWRGPDTGAAGRASPGRWPRAGSQTRRGRSHSR